MIRVRSDGENANRMPLSNLDEPHAEFPGEPHAEFPGKTEPSLCGFCGINVPEI